MDSSSIRCWFGTSCFTAGGFSNKGEFPSKNLALVLHNLLWAKWGDGTRTVRESNGLVQTRWGVQQSNEDSGIEPDLQAPFSGHPRVGFPKTTRTR